MISPQLSRQLKIEYLNSLSGHDLAFWLINSFSPERYHDKSDVIEIACQILYEKLKSDLAIEFIERLWGMFGLLPEPLNFVRNNVIEMRK